MGNRLPAGIKKVRTDWANPFFRRPKRIAFAPQTPEQKAASIALVDGICAAMERTPAAERATNKIKDREARVAVEGDTDMNHDNVEAAE